MSSRARLEAWVDECARLTQPDKTVWLTGSQQEYDDLIAGMLADGSMVRLNPERYPNSYLYRSDPDDVARTEDVTYICTTRKEDATPTNNWMAPAAAKARLTPLFSGAMRGRTMYVIPYLMGPVGAELGIVGVELTDSPYVAVSMRIMTRMGDVAMKKLDTEDCGFVGGLHSIGDLDPKKRFIMHFPEENLIWSVGSGYGGNALLGKKCLSLRLASWRGRNEGWMAEHMLILGLEDPQGNVTYMGGAFPSACGKTNLAMLVSPLKDHGWKVHTLGDDICWMRVDEDGRLWAVNPETGFFGVAPGTNAHTNPNAMQALSRNSIFTNVAITPAGDPWWEGIDPESDTPPPGTIDWRGNVWKPAAAGEKTKPAAHPNARFTAPASQCPSIAANWEDPKGVPISIMIFGGRRKDTAPLVYQSFNWRHGVFVGASMASETTAAATVAQGVLRRDPMAMSPFTGYNMGDYWTHWIEMGAKLKKPPAIFHVNWFRRDERGKFLWPGYGENIRVLMWMIERSQGRGKATETAIGYVPTADALDLDGLDISPETMGRLLTVNHDEWRREWDQQAAYFAKIGERMPPGITEEHASLGRRIGVEVKA